MKATMNRQYSDKLMKIYELNAAIMDECDRWECYADYPDEAEKSGIDAIIAQLQICCDTLSIDV